VREDAVKPGRGAGLAGPGRAARSDLGVRGPPHPDTGL